MNTITIYIFEDSSLCTFDPNNKHPPLDFDTWKTLFHFCGKEDIKIKKKIIKLGNDWVFYKLRFTDLHSEERPYVNTEYAEMTRESTSVSLTCDNTNEQIAGIIDTLVHGFGIKPEFEDKDVEEFICDECREKEERKKKRKHN